MYWIADSFMKTIFFYFCTQRLILIFFPESAEAIPTPPSAFHLLCPSEDQAIEHALCGQW